MKDAHAERMLLVLAARRKLLRRMWDMRRDAVIATGRTRLFSQPERARIEKRVVERNVVRIRTATQESEQILSQTVRHEEVDIRRVPVNREIEAVPDVRDDGEVIVIPIVEERAVLVKRLILVEELHVRRKVVQQDVEVPVRLHSTEVFVESERSPDGEPP